MKGKRWLLRGDIVFDCSAYRLPYEQVIRNRGSNGVGRYGMGVARRWLSAMGARIDRHHAFVTHGIPSSRPDFFDHSTRIAYEVKTGRHPLTVKSLNQIKSYERAVRTRQASLVTYLNVAFNGEVGMNPRFREELRKRGFRLLILR